MKANPGGQIAPFEVIGRDELIQRLWHILERQSLVLCAERRIGKTCVIKKMVAEVPQDKLPIYHDIENMHTPIEFVETVFHDVESYLSSLTRNAKRARQFLAQFSGSEIGDVIKFPNVVASHWKTLLTSIIEDLLEHQKGAHQKRTVIFFWDEMPLMLNNLKQRNGEDEAMEVLDTLRSARQMHKDLRMVFTGSIGLHNVITSLKQAGYANDPTNDMYTMDVPPLSHSDAQKLSRLLLKGEGIQTDNPQATAKAIAESVDCIPHYIHHVVDKMVERGGEANVTIVGKIVAACLTDPLDNWHMYHYLRRIDTYYTPEEQPFALGLLDILAASDQPLLFDVLFNLLKSRVETEDTEMVRHTLMLLQRDHYILQQTDGSFHFRFPMIQRWWRLQRGLSS